MTLLASLLVLGAIDVDHATWDRIVSHHVREERVDYLSLRRDDWQALEGYLDQLAAVDLEPLGRDQQLAYYLNLYNATMVHTVMRRFHADYTVAEDSFGVFDEPLVRTRKGTLSLNALENEVIRPGFQDPRIHVGLVCGARSCPPLLARAYRADDLDEVLDANLKRFLGDTTRNRLDAETKELRLSRIFEWYAADFGGAGALPAFVSPVLGRSLDGWRVGQYLDYSWDLNGRAPKEGRWVRVREDDTALRNQEGETLEAVRKGAVFEVLGERQGLLQVRRPFGQGEAVLEQSATRVFPADS